MGYPMKPMSAADQIKGSALFYYEILFGVLDKDLELLSVCFLK